MENITPQHLGVIAILTAIAMSSSMAYQCRAQLASWFRTAWRRYVETRPAVVYDTIHDDSGTRNNNEMDVSPVAMPETQETDRFGFGRVSGYTAIAKLLDAGLLASETKALETVYGVRPGSSAAYKAARDGLLAAKHQRLTPAQKIEELRAELEALQHR